MTAIDDSSDVVLSRSFGLNRARRAAWLDRCRALDRETVLSVLEQADSDQWAFSLTLDRAYRLDTPLRGRRATTEEQDAVVALLSARVLFPGNFRTVELDGWPPRESVPLLFITSQTGRDFYDELRRGDR